MLEDRGEETAGRVSSETALATGPATGPAPRKELRGMGSGRAGDSSEDTWLGALTFLGD